ncbi:hypothetical protein BS78_05G002300 [Paspalum vaginatum]|nr:hypothetical protein BS78_05G002300 [Paspalum vaginatum]
MEDQEGGRRHARAQQRRRRPRRIPASSSSSSSLSPPPPPTAPTPFYDYLVQVQPPLPSSLFALSYYHQQPPPDLEYEPPVDAPPPSKRACIAASDEAMLGLREVEVMPASSDDDCAICLTSLLVVHPPDSSEEEERIRAMPCSHAFHQRCIFQWLSRNAVCPLCRHALQQPPTTTDDHRTMTVHEMTFRTLDDEDRYIASLGDAIIHLQDGTEEEEEEEEEEVDEEMEERIRQGRALVQRWMEVEDTPSTPTTIIIDPRTGIEMSAE